MALFIHQNEENNCGLASLKMFLANYYKKSAYLFENIKQPTTNFLEIIDVANQYGVHLTGYDTGIQEKNAVFQTQKMLIAQLLIGENSHFVFVFNIGRLFVRVYDPIHGIILLTRKAFLNIFTGKFLVAEEKAGKSQIEKIFYPQPPRRYYFSWLLSLISISSLIIAFYFVDDGVSIYRPLIFILIAGIFALLERAFLLSVMKDFQKRYIDEHIAAIKMPYLNNFNNVFLFKKGLFYRQQQLFTTITASIVVVFLLVFNGFWHIIALLIILIMTLVSDSIHQLIRGNEYQALAQQSKFIAHLNNQEINEANTVFHVLSAISDRISEKRVFMQLITTIFIFLLAFLIMSISRVASLNYLLFHFVIYHQIYSSIYKLIAAPNHQLMHNDEINNYLEAFNNKEPNQVFIHD